MEKSTRKTKLNSLNSADLQRNILLEHGRVPPQATDLEEVVLGALMLQKEAINAVIDILQPEVFYKEANQKIFFFF